jgi:hypothetical protein
MTPTGFPLTSLSLEARLLLLCCRAQRGAVVEAELDALLSQGPDWAQLVELALLHGVTPLVERALSPRGETLVPEAIRTALHEHTAVVRARNRELLAELEAIVAALDGRGIRALPFKGPVLSELAYGDALVRPPGDLDFLVDLAELERVREMLAARGFVDEYVLRRGRALSPSQEAWVRRSQCQQLLVRPRDGMHVEPHWELVPSTLAVRGDLGGLWERARPVSVGGKPFPTLADEDLLLFLCVHGSKHEWTELRWVSDIAELVARRDRLDWAALLGRAQDQGSLRMLVIGLLLARDLLGAGLPAPAAAAAAGDPTAAALVRSVTRRLFDPRYQARSVTRPSWFRLRMRERPRDAVAYLLRTAFTPSMAHLQVLSLPRPLWFLYYPAKLAIDVFAFPLLRWSRRRQDAATLDQAASEPTSATASSSDEPPSSKHGTERSQPISRATSDRSSA